jgi:hypothetical protein
VHNAFYVDGSWKIRDKENYGTLFHAVILTNIPPSLGFNMNKNLPLKKALLLTAFSFTVTSATAQSIYTHDFIGDGTTQLNGTTTTTGGGTWVANTITYTDGTMSTGEGSALLEFTPVVNAQYRLSMDLTHAGSGDWVGLGFARDQIANAGADSAADRFTGGPEGMAWILYRDDATDADDIQLFAGLRATNQIAGDTGVYTAGTHTLSILIDTTGDGSSFTADFSIDGSSISGGAQTISLAVADLNYAGFTSADDGSGVNTYVDNFSLVQIPEPGTSAMLIGLFSLGFIAIRRRQ